MAFSKEMEGQSRKTFDLNSYSIKDIQIFAKDEKEKEDSATSIKDSQSDENTIKEKEEKKTSQDTLIKQYKKVGVEEFKRRNAEKMLGADEVKLSKEEYDTFQSSLAEFKKAKEQNENEKTNENTISQTQLDKLKEDHSKAKSKLQDQINLIQKEKQDLEKRNLEDSLRSNLYNKAVQLNAHNPDDVVNLALKKITSEKDPSTKSYFHRILDSDGEARLKAETGKPLTPVEYIHEMANENEKTKYLFKPHAKSGLGIGRLAGDNRPLDVSNITREDMKALSDDDFIKMQKNNGGFKYHSVKKS